MFIKWTDIKKKKPTKSGIYYCTLDKSNRCGMFLRYDIVTDNWSSIDGNTRQCDDTVFNIEAWCDYPELYMNGYLKDNNYSFILIKLLIKDKIRRIFNKRRKWTWILYPCPDFV